MKRTLLRTVLAVAALLASSFAPQPTIRSSVDFVELGVFVTDGRGEFVKDLIRSSPTQDQHAAVPRRDTVRFRIETASQTRH